MREQMAAHRANAVCASCHKLMDPIGLALENFDAIGRWRTTDAAGPIDATGDLLDGTHVDGVVQLRQALLKRPEVFVGTMTEKLLTYALKRGVEAPDMPTVRAIVRDVSRQNYRFSSLVLGVVKSPAFQMRTKAGPVPVAAVRRPPADSRSAGSLNREDAAAMNVRKLQLPRRTFPAGMGATVALPLLDAMVPSFTALAKTAANPQRRFGAVYIPHGAIMERYTPKQAGAGFDFTPILKPLEPFKENVVVVSNLDRPGIDDSHATASAAWLSGAIAKKTEGQDFRCGQTVDQVIAKQIGGDTPFPSIEIATENLDGYVGGCSPGYACAYMNTISWTSETTPVPMEINPRVVFERLFGRPGTFAQRKARARQDASILDSVTEDLGDLSAAWDRATRAGSNEYLENVREIEQRIQRTEARNTSEAVAAARRADRHPGVVPGARRADVRPDGGGLRGRPDPRVHVHDGARGQHEDLSGGRHHRAAPHDLAPPREARREDGARGAEHLSHVDVREVRRQAEGDARRRRHAARPLAGVLRQRHEQRQRPRSVSAAARGGERLEGQGPSAHGAGGAHAAGQPVGGGRRHVRSAPNASTAKARGACRCSR